MNRMISFGYGFADGKLSVIAEEAETVKGIFSDYVNGKILKEIADDLTARQVNFFNGKCSWNKNMIFRIIENGKYIGEDGYPAIIPIALFERANLIKKQKSKVKIELSEETETLKKYVYCGECGRLLHRRSKWRTREKWYCLSDCKCERYIDDRVIMSAVDTVGNAIRNNPDLLNVETCDTYKRTQEIMRYTNEIARMTSSANPSFKTGKTMIFECANLKFQACHENKSLAYTDKVIQYSKSGVYDVNYIVNVVSKIIIETDGTVTVEMINGTKLNDREVGNANAGKKNSNENSRESDSRKAE